VPDLLDEKPARQRCRRAFCIDPLWERYVILGLAALGFPAMSMPGRLRRNERNKQSRIQAVVIRLHTNVVRKGAALGVRQIRSEGSQDFRVLRCAGEALSDRRRASRRDHQNAQKKRDAANR